MRGKGWGGICKKEDHSAGEAEWEGVRKESGESG